MTRSLNLAAVIIIGVVTWIVCSVVIDWLVLQIYPLPPGLWGHASMREILATRPDAAMALNIGGQLLALGAIAFGASRKSKSGAVSGVLITGVIVALSILNAVTTATLRWVHALALPVALLIGLGAAKWGASIGHSARHALREQMPNI